MNRTTLLPSPPLCSTHRRAAAVPLDVCREGLHKPDLWVHSGFDGRLARLATEHLSQTQ